MPGDNMDARKIFAEQFEPDGDGFLYRYRGKSAPIRVTAAERERFIADFNKRCGYMVWGSAAFMSVAVLLSVLFKEELAPLLHGYQIYVFVVLLIPTMWILNRKAYRAPAQELRHRIPVGVERSSDEVRRRAVARMSWGFLAGVSVFGAVYFAGRIPQSGFDSGWGAIWIAGAVCFFGAMTFGAYRKWRYGRSPDD